MPGSFECGSRSNVRIWWTGVELVCFNEDKSQRMAGNSAVLSQESDTAKGREPGEINRSTAHSLETPMNTLLKATHQLISCVIWASSCLGSPRPSPTYVHAHDQNPVFLTSALSRQWHERLHSPPPVRYWFSPDPTRGAKNDERRRASMERME